MTTTTRDPRWALAGLSLSMLLSSLGTSIANVGLPTLSRTFGASLPEVQWVVIAYLLATTTLVVGAGRLGDALGRRRLLLVGVGLFTAASLLCAAAGGLWQLIAARAAQGTGAALMMALTLAFVGEAVPKERVGSAMGLLGTMSAIGTTLGSSLGGILIDGCGWRSLFLINLPLGLLAMGLVHRHLPADHRPPTARSVSFDHPGTALLAMTLAAYALAMTLGLGLLAVAFVGGLLLVLVEARAESPLIRLAALRDPVLGAGLALNALVATVVMATLVIGPFYLSGAFSLDAAEVGLGMSCGPLVSMLAGVPSGRLVDRFGASRVAISGLVAMAVGAAVMVLMPTKAGLIGYLIPLAAITTGYALFQAANNTAVMTTVTADQRGTVSGMLTLSRNLGLITGASAMGSLFSFGMGLAPADAPRPESVATGMRLTFAVAGALLVVGLVIAAGSRVGASPQDTRKA